MKKLAAPGRKGSIKKTSFETDDLVEEVVPAAGAGINNSSKSNNEAVVEESASAAPSTPVSVTPPVVKQTVWRRETDGADVWYIEMTTGESVWEIPAGGSFYMPPVPQTTVDDSAAREKEERARARAKAREEQARAEEEEAAEAEKQEQIAAERLRLQQQKQKQQDGEEKRREQVAEANRQLQEAQDREHEAELEEEKVRLENARKAEEASLRKEREDAAEQLSLERSQREEEARKATAVKSNEDTAKLAERRRKLEEDKRKKAAFLNGVDSFQTDYQEKVAEDVQKRSEIKEGESDKITSQMKSMSQNFRSDASAGYVEAQVSSIPAPARTAPVIRSEPRQESVPSHVVASSSDDSSSSIRLQGGSARSKYTSDLFNSNSEDSSDIFSFSSSSSSTATAKTVGPASDELSTPIGIGAKAKSKSDKKLDVSRNNNNDNNNTTNNNNPNNTNSGSSSNATSTTNKSDNNSSIKVASAPASTPSVTISSKGGNERKKNGAAVGDNYDDENVEEGGGADDNADISNFLTVTERQELNENQKAAWRVLQADMKSKRKDFHGAVTYAFEGVFSWQMYGSTEAVDESGKSYTEYLMRCQWGPSFDNMQPWIVGRRYREFDQLDEELKDQYPELAPRFKKLAEKNFFSYLDASVVNERRMSMEEYISHFVQTMPTILRSGIMDEFLNVSPRIRHIKASMVKNGTWAVTLPASGEISTPVPVAGGIACSEILIVSSDQAERLRLEGNIPALDELSMGVLEEDVRELWLILCRSGTREVGRRARSRVLILSLSNRWPALKASMDFSNTDISSLIPRAMQAEEDFQRCFREFKVLVGPEAKELGGVATAAKAK